MAEKNNTTCSICGRDYHMCLSCKDSISLAPWKVHTDTAEHYKVFQIIRGFSTGLYTKDEAKIKFENVDLSDLNDFRPHIKTIIKDILKEEKPAIVPAIVSMVEDEIANEIVVEDAETVEKPVYFRKKNYKIEVE